MNISYIRAYAIEKNAARKHEFLKSYNIKKPEQKSLVKIPNVSN